MRSMKPGQIVISVEHASARVPEGLDNLGLPRSFLATHHGWDPGAAEIGSRLAEAFNAPLHLGTYSRLVADLNRSAFHPGVIARESGARRIPANQGLTSAQRRRRLDRFWRPYRTAVEADLDERVAGFGVVLHVSVHSFTPRLNGETRGNDFGLLYKPARRAERAMADRWHHVLAGFGFDVRRNYPYSGLDDGFCMRMRAERPARRYLGMEIEVNQKRVRRDSAIESIAVALVAAISAELG